MVESGSTPNQAGTITVAVGIVSVFSSSNFKNFFFFYFNFNVLKNSSRLWIHRRLKARQSHNPLLDKSNTVWSVLCGHSVLYNKLRGHHGTNDTYRRFDQRQ